MTRDLRARYGGWALVTGASSGIGECYALSLARRGFPVVLVARRRDRLEALAKRLRAEHGADSRIVVEDLTDPAAPERIAAAASDLEIGVLVNNAGFGYSGRFADGDRDEDARMVQVNCAAVVALTHRFLPPMLARRRGAIVIVSSLAGFQPTPFFAVYGATKAFDLVLAEALWSELRGTGVDVIALCPGSTRTEFSLHAHMNRPPDGPEPGPIVERSLGKLGGPPSWVPGLGNKFAKFLSWLLPRGMVANATGSVLAKELLRKTPAELRAQPPRTPPVS